MESAVSGPIPFSASRSARKRQVGAANIRSSDPPHRASRNATKFFSRCAFCRKYPEERMSFSNFGNDTSRMPATLSLLAARRLAIARSTFVHEVFCVRIAPTMTSNGVSAGHQCCRPQARASLRYIARTAASGFSVGPTAADILLATMRYILRFLWNATRGHRLAPWRSPYLRWRIETYTGIKMQSIGFLEWTGEMERYARVKPKNP